jgi:hypothetical protein
MLSRPRRPLFASGLAVGLAMIAPIASAARPDFPRSVYPAAASWPAWGGPDGCASIEGVRAPRAGATAAALRLLSHYGDLNKTEDLRLSDRAEWPVVRETWSHGYKPAATRPLQMNDVYGAPASRSPYAGLVRRWCGKTLLRRSWWIAVCPRASTKTTTPCSRRWQTALTGHFLLINRRGHWLVWFNYP